MNPAAGSAPLLDDERPSGCAGSQRICCVDRLNDVVVASTGSAIDRVSVNSSLDMTLALTPAQLNFVVGVRKSCSVL
jgi:hypothetical protein